jgi:hypothetical protein
MTAGYWRSSFQLSKTCYFTLVIERASLRPVDYGNVQPEILVELRNGIQAAPAMLNREIKSGYWDCPTTELTGDVRLLFINFFDWDQLDYRDNRYVRVQIDRWSLQPQTIGKHALIEPMHVQFTRTNIVSDVSKTPP